MNSSKEKVNNGRIIRLLTDLTTRIKVRPLPATPMVAKISDMEVRIDKWLWAVRVFKTRTLAATACKKGRVLLNGQEARSSKTVRENDIITVSLPGINRIFRVLTTIEKRVGAKLAVLAVREETPAEALERYNLIRQNPLAVLTAVRPRGSGRPSKKERRELELFTEQEGLTEDFAEEGSEEDP
jgi:ribosome-associated heat shock protein Hsp15